MPRVYYGLLAHDPASREHGSEFCPVPAFSLRESDGVTVTVTVSDSDSSDSERPVIIDSASDLF